MNNVKIDKTAFSIGSLTEVSDEKAYLLFQNTARTNKYIRIYGANDIWIKSGSEWLQRVLTAIEPERS